MAALLMDKELPLLFSEIFSHTLASILFRKIHGLEALTMIQHLKHVTPKKLLLLQK